MTLPPNCLPPETPAIATGLPAVPGLAAGVAETPGAAPFADVLAGAAPTPAANVPASEPTVPAQALYSGVCYNSLFQPTQGEAGDVETDSTVADEPTVADDSASPTEQAAAVLTYQLIAGQWVPQPPPPVTPQDLTSPQGDTDEKPDAITDGGRSSVCSFPASPSQPGKELISSGAEAEETPASRPVGGKTTAATEPFSTAKTVENAPKSNSPEKVVPVTESSPEREAPKVSPAKDFLADGSPAAVPAAPATTNAPAESPVDQAPSPKNSPGEKFAAFTPARVTEIASGENSPSRPTEKKSLVADVKEVKSNSRQVGTSAANRDYSMPYSAANKTVLPSSAVLPAPASAGGIHNSTTTQAAVETNSSPTVQAPRLVQEIRAIADRVSTIDRNTVEVRFDFNEADRLSVRVEYRDGTVHTTFRTDSAPLREVIAREWQAQAVQTENRNYRVAEPIFSTNSLNADSSQSGLGSGQSHSRAFEQQSSTGFAGFGQSGRASTGSLNNSGSAPVPTVRPETSLHLHTFA